MLSKKREILSLTRETFESSSIHAIPNIIRNKFVSIKIVWLICFMVSFGGCAWFMVNSINDYLQNEVVTSFRVNYVNELTFPVIGICNLNFVTKEPLNAYIVSRRGKDNPEMFFLEPLRFVAFNLFKNNKRMIDFDPNDIFLGYTFAREETLSNFSKDWHIYYDSQYGACLKFNSLQNDVAQQKIVYGGGYSFGFEIELFIGDVDKNNNIFSREHGFILFIQNQSIFDSQNIQGIKIMPGTSTSIILSKNSWKKKPKPYSDCTADLTSKDSHPSQIYKESFLQNKTYSYFDCFNLCYSNLVESKCKCSISTLNSNIRKCYFDDDLAQNDFTCYTTTFKLVASDPSIMNACDCPVECERTYFTYLPTYSQFPTLKYSSYLLESDLITTKYPNITTYEDLKKNVARIEIFFDEMKETVIEESVKTEMSDLISNLGGTLGLFLGLSFLSLIEFVEVFLQAILITFHKDNQTKIFSFNSKS